MKGFGWIQRALDFFFPPIVEERKRSPEPSGDRPSTFEEKDLTLCDMREKIKAAIAKRDAHVTNGNGQ